MNYKVIATGSTGNAVLINDSMLIDCGVSFSAIRPYMKDLRIVMLTHAHGDHFNTSTIRKLAELRPTLRWVSPPWLVPELLKCVNAKMIDIAHPGKALVYGQFHLFIEETFHDVKNCCYHVHFANGEKLFYATDTSSLDGISAKNYSLYMVEANYEDDEIMQRIADKKNMGEYSYEERVLRTHLSKAKADDFIYRNIGPSSEYVYLHKHVEQEGGWTMTANQRRKQAKHNAEKDGKRRHYTVAEIEQIQSDLRRQAAELTADIEAKNDALSDTWYDWVATWNQYVIPRLSVGFYTAAFRIMKKYLVAGAMDAYMRELSESMQNVINDVGMERFSFEDCADELSKAGYSVPEWAEEEDFDVVIERIKAAKEAHR